MKKNSGMKKVTIGVTAAALAAAMSMSVFAAATGVGGMQGMNGMAQQGMEMQMGGREGFGGGMRGGFENRMDRVKEKIDALCNSLGYTKL